MTSSDTFVCKNLKLNKAHVLGTGSYGAVCKAKCDDLPCAAKLLYPVLFELHEHNHTLVRQNRLPLKRFEQECQFLSQIKHPNIVQYLGTYNDPDTKAPVLLMELMDESLTHFLESTPGPVAYHVQVNICHDIALALSYLHSNDIIHRDLSSNNVLLMAGSRAKVTDFGMSKFTDATGSSLTLCPGTMVYMSPEALNEPPVYTEKLDIFSHGVLTVQIITKLFPDPSNRFTSIEVADPRDPKKKTQGRFSITEIQRRQSHIDKVPKDNILLTIALLSLNDEDSKRPSASELCHSLEVLKDNSLYKNSVTNSNRAARQACPVDKTIEKFKNLIEEQLVAHKEEVAQLKHDLKTAQEFSTKDKTATEELLAAHTEIAQLKSELEEAREEIKAKDQMIKMRTSQNLQLKEKLKAKHINQLPASQAQENISFQWRKSHTHPKAMNTYTGPLQLDGTVCYVKCGELLCTFNIHTNIWSSIEKLPSIGAQIVVLNNLITAVGGKYHHTPSNKLWSLIRKETQTYWEELFPPMKTERYSATAFYTDKILAVAGGMGKGNIIQKTVEIMMISTQQWSIVSSLPYPLWGASADVCEGMVYMIGGEDNITGTKAALMCSLNELCMSKQDGVSVWKNIKELPVIHATATSFQGHLLAVGGKDLISGEPDAAIRQYNPLTDEWQIVSHMNKAKAYCYTHVYYNTLIVIEGVDNSRRITHHVEIANLTSK